MKSIKCLKCIKWIKNLINTSQQWAFNTISNKKHESRVEISNRIY